MTKSEQLASRLREVILNGTWIANTNIRDQIEDLDWKIATKKVESLNTNSILAQHIHYFLVGIKNVFDNGKLEIKDKCSFEFQLLNHKLNGKYFKISFGTTRKNLQN